MRLRKLPFADRRITRKFWVELLFMKLEGRPMNEAEPWKVCVVCGLPTQMSNYCESSSRSDAPYHMRDHGDVIERYAWMAVPLMECPVTLADMPLDLARRRGRR